MFDRNIERFPANFRFEITEYELNNLRSQHTIPYHAGRRYLPYVFTEQGIAMLSAVLKSQTAENSSQATLSYFKD